MPSTATEQTTLAAKLIRRIETDGPISVSEFMTACLADPEHGYYTRHDPLGRSGDFITAPEISQIFGELIGIWCLAAWQAMGSPDRFVLAELGPGRGTLMADALRAARLRPGFGDAATIALVEINEGLKTAQRTALQDLATPIWVDRPDALPSGPLIVIANEFFDALPIRQFVRTDKGWAERMVGLGDNGSLAFGLQPLPELGFSPPADGNVPEGAVYEACPSATAITAALSERIAHDGGAALFIDYGHAEPGFGDTLQAVRSHRYDDPLAHPGRADLTAHVDFAALARAASGGSEVRPVIDQATFLERMGIDIRAETLARGQDEPTQSAIASAVERLAGTDQMGRLFKAFAFASKGINLPAFDSTG